MWYSTDFCLNVTVRFDPYTLTEGGTVARCAVLIPSSTKVIDLGMCKIKKKFGDEFEELKLTNVESGMYFVFIKGIE